MNSQRQMILFLINMIIINCLFVSYVHTNENFSNEKLGSKITKNNMETIKSLNLLENANRAKKSSLHNTNKLILNSKKAKSSQQPEKPEELPDGFSSWFEGWVHYYKYDNDTNISRPKNFFVNKEFFAQRKKMKNLMDKDQYGGFHIPDKNSFYVVLTAKDVNVYSNRDDPFLNQVDSLSYKDVEPIPSDQKFKGGVQDLFRFSIGYCLLVKIKFKFESSSKTAPQRWVFCVDDQKQKTKLLHALIRAKTFDQNRDGEILSSAGINLDKSTEDMQDYLRGKKSSAKYNDLKKNQKAIDGYWITINEWTECNVKCGGGLSFKQRMCIPPKGNGRPCIGEEISTKECNTQPCPDAAAYQRELELAKPIVNNPIVKIGTFSERPQRYTKCIIKDVDAFFTEMNTDTMTEQKIPSRVVMNNRTISVYKSDNYQDLALSFDLQQSSFKIPDNSFCCFKLADKLKSVDICGYQKMCGEAAKNTWANQWSKDFNLFKTKCKEGFEESLLDGDDESLLEKQSKDKMKQAGLEMSKAKKIKIKNDLMNDQTDSLRQDLMNTQKIGFEAIEKELDIESMLKDEEKEKEQDDLKLLADRLNKENDKLKCIKEGIQEKEIDNEFIAQQHQVNSDLVGIKQEFNAKILKKRKALKDLLEKMKRRSRLEKSKLESEIKTLRNKISEDVMTAQRNGSTNTCHEGKINTDKRVKYCDEKFVDDYINNGDCKKKEEFCYLCCETEFGNNFIDKRETCYQMCDRNEDPANEPPGDHWSWKAKGN